MKIAPELEQFVRPMDTMTLLPGNPRRGDVEAIAASLRRFGQRKPIVVDPDGVIVAGNHLYQAGLLIGADGMAAIDAADLSPEDRQAYVLADNRLSDLGSYDDEALIELLTNVADAAGLDGTGYDSDDLMQLAAELDHVGGFVPGDGTDQGRLDTVQGDTRAECPHCGETFAWGQRANR